MTAHMNNVPRCTCGGSDRGVALTDTNTETSPGPGDSTLKRENLFRNTLVPITTCFFGITHQGGGSDLRRTVNVFTDGWNKRYGPATFLVYSLEDYEASASGCL